MKHIKEYHLFESSYNGHNWTRDEFEQVLNDPENAENPFITANAIGHNSVIKDIQNFINGWKSINYRITANQFFNLIKYLVIIDDRNIGISVLAHIMPKTRYLEDEKYSLLTHYFDRHYFDDQLDTVVKEKIHARVYPENTTLEKLDEYVDEIEGSTFAVSHKKLAGKDLQVAIDAALDARDFKEARRLSALMESKKKL